MTEETNDRYVIRQLLKKEEVVDVLVIAEECDLAVEEEDISLCLQNEEHFCLMVFDRQMEKAVAFVYWHDCRNESLYLKLSEKDLYIQDIGVMQEHQRLHLGRNLIDRVMEELYKHKEKTRLVADVHELNDVGHSFFAANKFKAIGVMRRGVIYESGDAYRFVYKKEGDPKRGPGSGLSAKRRIPREFPVPLVIDRQSAFDNTPILTH